MALLQFLCTQLVSKLLSGLVFLISALVTANIGTDVAHVTALNDDGLYTVGDKIDIVVRFNSIISVDGQPELLLAVPGKTIKARYIDSRGYNSLIFRYTVEEGHFSTDLSYDGRQALLLNGGSITNVLGELVNVRLPGPGGDHSLSFNKNIRIDGASAARALLDTETRPRD